MGIDLRDHQVEAVDAIIRGLDIPPGKRVPRTGIRGQVRSACGTGKTVMAAAAARRMLPHGRVLVVVPTLELLTQTVREWRKVGHEGPAVAVCSLQDDAELWSMEVRCTTSPVRLALWHGTGPVTVYATYASLGVLVEAFEGVYGQQLAPMDLVVVDEAHRTSGSLGKAWADVHDHTVIPSARRLYMTATPRIWQERPPHQEVREGRRDALPEEMAASMDDTGIFGPVLYELTLAQAVTRGLLARYQIIVVELADPVVTPERLGSEERHEEEIRGERLAALQAAMLRTAVDHDLKTMITFHHRTIEAEAYATGLPAVAKRLHTADPGRYPKTVWAGWLQGEHPAEHRRQILEEFAARTGLAMLSNCKVLGEGVDIRAVDSVALLDPKDAPHDIVQAIGRALRQKPDEGKLASLVVPVFLGPEEQPEDMFTSGSYKPLVNVLQGLRAHDESAVELLAIPQEPQKQSVEPSLHIGPAPGEGEAESRLLLRFSVPRDPVMIAEWVSFNVIDTERQDWARGYAALKRYVLREGHALVPYGHREQPGPYPLGYWVSQQRKTYRAGTLTGKRAERLKQLGMVWEAEDAAFQENLAAARAWAEQHWGLCAPRAAVALGKPVGQWLSNLRRPGVLDGYPERAAALAAIDPDWNPDWPVEWQRTYAYVRELLADEGTSTTTGSGTGIAVLQPGVTVHGTDVGRWLHRQRQHTVWRGLMDGQRERLARLGITPLPAPAKTRGKAGKGVGAFERGVAALAQYKTRTGTVVVPRGHTEVLEDGWGPDGDGEKTEVRLGVWMSNTKTRRTGLTDDKLAILAALGLHWTGTEAGAGAA
ncbi:helicase (plasmid) [Streptomyces clavuligerus]|uniref:DEAD/DEAH box helicase n=6 Tax=Streptomyces clavuligerus TaxID=1901 RepID=UPI0002F01F23|nr:DEAD/DEAH box helicase [Streptomyces clavuligerus]QCS09539.1 helicase [Streptomyces clavuligerus]QPJ98409.1 DEAD/DEAH box helicase [Streptomyces clavuligerus]WDN56266.1 Helicase associated domain protein [Streptomyces clavuligerus]